VQPCSRAAVVQPWVLSAVKLSEEVVIVLT
jgi:hypothetical protein